ncbi:hypothetical protein DF286_04055 [Sphingosinicella humi]|uniref:Uncharacterized protein n=1 Tax=Allosphingosinicella humi TaxID=2068657 RepID=A0A2U2J1D7_9SPHN|nr:hypothetical protein DF286_04055 [Sphingosinicella humi]
MTRRPSARSATSLRTSQCDSPKPTSSRRLCGWPRSGRSAGAISWAWPAPIKLRSCSASTSRVGRLARACLTFTGCSWDAPVCPADGRCSRSWPLMRPAPSSTKAGRNTGRKCALESEGDLLLKLERWLATRSRPPTLGDVLETRDIGLLGAYILKGFRAAAAEAVEQRERVARVRRAAIKAFDGCQDQAEDFLRSHHDELGGGTPLHIAVSSDEGAEAVLQILAHR